MPPLPVISGKEAARAFARAGWIYERKHGSHIIMIKPGLRANLSIPDHKTLDRGTLRSLIRKAGMSVDEFLSYL
ncbi:MAG: type II toxin-antitoxin system HicA family toxin [Armatimonadetes bacterium]|nr:type II toxin-antitoxin system HicA family toxin [Armatimonadota bacterium]